MLVIHDDFDPKANLNKIRDVRGRLNGPLRYGQKFKPSTMSDDEVRAAASKAFGCSVHFLELHKQYERARVARLLAIRILHGIGRSPDQIISSMRCREKDIGLSRVEFDPILPCGARYSAEEMIQFGADGYGEILEQSPPEEIIYLVADRFSVPKSSMQTRNKRQTTDVILARDVYIGLCRYLCDTPLAEVAESVGRSIYTVMDATNRMEPVLESISFPLAAPAYRWVEAVAVRLGK